MDDAEKIRLRSDDELRRHAAGLLEIANHLRVARIPFFVGGGTLLGIVRDNALIPWDWDVEIDFRAEDIYPHRKQVLADLRGSGFAISRVDRSFRNFKIKAEKFGTVYELLAWQRHGEFRHRRRYRLREEFFRRPSNITFAGVELPTFSSPEAYLEFQYGDWRTPLRSSDKAAYLSRDCLVPPSAATNLALRLHAGVARFRHYRAFEHAAGR